MTLLISGVITLFLALTSGDGIKEAAARAAVGPTLQMKKFRDSRANVHGFIHRHKSGKISAKGWVSVTHFDTKTGPGHYGYTLHTDDGDYTLLLPADVSKGDGPSGTLIAPGQVVEGAGTINGDTVTLATAQVTGETAPYGLTPGQSPVTENTRDVLVIPVTFTDSTTIGTTKTALEGIFNGAGKSVRSYYLASSSQRVTLTAKVLNVTPLGIPKGSTCAADTWTTKAKEIAALGGETLANYEHVVVVYPTSGTGCFATNFANINGDNSWIGSSGSDPDFADITHELGHNLGLSHSNAMACTADDRRVPLSKDCDSYEYYDSSDTMGSRSDKLLTGFHRAMLGFLPLQNTTNVDPTVAGTYPLYDDEDLKTAGTPQLLRIPRARAITHAGREDEQYLYVDLRKKQTGALYDDFDSLDPQVGGVSVRLGSDYYGSGAQAFVGATMKRPYRPDVNSSFTTLRSTYPLGTATTGTLVADFSLRPKQSLYDPYENVTVTNQATSTAGVASVSVAPGSPRGAATNVGIVGGQLRIRAGAGVVNDVLVSTKGTDIIVSDTGATLGLLGGCTTINAITAACPKSTITSIDIDLGDLDDATSILAGVTAPTTIRGGDGADAIEGGDGDDVIDAGPGADIVVGGDGVDTISYATRTAPITFTNAVSRNDGEAGEHDTIETDVENVTGGSGADTITTPFAVPHVITGGAGADSITAGPKNDTVYARDGLKDTKIECGGDTDTVYYDNTVESPTNCTTNNWNGQAVILSGPAAGGATTSTAPVFTFTANNTTSTIQCKIESGSTPGAAAFGACGAAGTTIASSVTWTAPTQTPGVKTLSVKAMNGTTQQGTIVTRTFEIDTAAPDTAFTSTPAAATSGASATFVVAPGDPGTTLRCALDTPTFTPCTSPIQLDGLTEASHTLKVQAVDVAGNVDATPASYTWSVDKTAPDTVINTGPTGATTDSTPDFTFGGTPSADVSAYECRITETGSTAVVPFTLCATPFAGAALDDGSYTFEVRARDAAGNKDATPASRSFVLSQGAATVTLTTIAGQPTVTVTGGANKKDDFDVIKFGTKTNVLSSVPLVATAPCTVNASSTSAACAGATRAIVNTGSANDRIRIYGDIPFAVDGGSGDDELEVGAGSAADTFVGGTGNDSITYEERVTPVNVTLDGLANDGGTGENDKVGTDIETVIGTPLDDTLTGGTALVTLRGGDGNDTLQAGSGGADLDGGLGNDHLNGGPGIDTADYSQRTDPMSISLDPSYRSGTRVDENSEDDRIDSTVENAIGSRSTQTDITDYFIDNALDNELTAGAGNAFVWAPEGGDDSVTGSPGHDTFLDGPGDDNYYGMGGDDDYDADDAAEADVFSGGPGIDTAGYGNKPTGVTVTIGSGSNDGVPGEGDFVGADVENVYGSPYNDSITGNAEDNRLDGAAGDDVLDGGLGQDVLAGGDGVDTASYATRTSALRFAWMTGCCGSPHLVGGQGNEGDTYDSTEKFVLGSGNDVADWTRVSSGVDIDGGPGDDTLEGSMGNDRLVGGAGRDTIDGYDGDDTIPAQDADFDTVDCGSGNDHAYTDNADTTSNCEPQLLTVDAPVAPAATTNLSTDPSLGASLDWVHWSGTSSTALQRKTGTPQIVGWTKDGSGAVTNPTGSSVYSWTNAAVAPAAASSSVGVATGAANGRGFRFTVPGAGAAPRTLKVYVGVSGAGTSGQLKAWFNTDTVNSATSAAVASTGPVVDRVLTVHLQPYAYTDTLTVDWGQLTGGTSSTSKVVLYGAAIY
jgi:Ca2+-binding RTX toxin-like protein